ncbi:MAG TPA: amidohydrolase [Desulfocapsa sulfexigens]|nr:amidohydrolase [Desulfocapsa sulfexigens]
MKTVPNISPQLYSWMRDIRKTIHQHPELSFEELTTAAYINQKLSEIDIKPVRRIAGTGLVAEIGPPNAPVIVGLRADMDALPITEATGLGYASTNPGIMHSCGHDGHVAMLLGSAALLQKMELPGRVRFLFQPAEEKGNGAEKMIEEGGIKDLAAIFSGHIDTHFETGIITVDEGIICAYADPFLIQLTGSCGHAARPHECKDTIVAAAGLITSLQSLVSREVSPNHAAVLTVGKIRAGEIHNVVAGEASIEGTIRSTHQDARKRMLAGLKRMVNGAASYYDVKAELKFFESLPAVINSCTAASIARIAAQTVVAEKNVISQGPSSLGGEDFAFYLKEIPGCMVRFGAKVSDQTGPAHSPTFDFDDGVLPVGASWYAQVAQTYHQEYREL